MASGELETKLSSRPTACVRLDSQLLRGSSRCIADARFPDALLCIGDARMHCCGLAMGRGDDARQPNCGGRGVVGRKKACPGPKGGDGGVGFWASALASGLDQQARSEGGCLAWTGRIPLTAASCIHLQARPDGSMQARPASTQLGTDSPRCRSPSTSQRLQRGGVPAPR